MWASVTNKRTHPHKLEKIGEPIFGVGIVTQQARYQGLHVQAKRNLPNDEEMTGKRGIAHLASLK
jgi:hypothetical protein